MTEEQNKLIEDNINLVYFVYAKYFLAKDGGREKEDLISEGMLGLINAAIKYSPDKGVTFSTFACVCIHRKMCLYLRDNRERLEANIVSLDAPARVGDSDIITIADTIAGPEESIIDTILNEKQIFDSLVLSEQERQILTYKYLGYTQVEISKMLGLSRQRIGQAIEHARTRWQQGGKRVQKRGRPRG